MRKKHINIKKIMGLLLIIMTVFLIINHFSEKNIIKHVVNKEDQALSDLGYHRSDILTIKTMDQKLINLVLKNDYRSYMVKLISEPYFIRNDLNRYLAFYDQHLDLKSREIVEKVNTNRDYDYYTDSKSTDMAKGNLVLTNKYYYLDSSYQPTNLVVINSNYGAGQIKKEVYEAYLAMINASKEEHFNFYARSNYRSYTKQLSIYNNYVKQDGQAITDTYSARPGYSEHQTGLAMDIVTKTSNFETFVNTKECGWLIANAYQYGFILRYPEDKIDITGYKYEPWHYRYVGIEVATKIHDQKITFDEYYAYYLK